MTYYYSSDIFSAKKERKVSMKKRGLARLEAKTATGRVRQLQAICYLQLVIILEAFVFIGVLIYLYNF